MRFIGGLRTGGRKEGRLERNRGPRRGRRDNCASKKSHKSENRKREFQRKKRTFKKKQFSNTQKGSVRSLIELRHVNLNEKEGNFR